MNPFYNPGFLLKMGKGYFFDINRLQRLSNTQLKKYQTLQLKKLIKRAFTVPMYNEIYTKAGIKKDMIRSIKDIAKLPIISKEDFNNYKPHDIIPSNKSINEFVKVSTSGTTGKSLTIYVDMYEIVMGLFGYLRAIKNYGLNWRKDNLSIIGDFASHTAETGYIKHGLLPNTFFKSIFNTIQWLDTNSKPEQVISELERFNPKFIGGYTGMLGHLAVLKTQGYGKKLQPKLIASTGALLDPNLKKFIEETFEAQLFEVYGATETGLIAYQCENDGIYHIMSDFLHLEFMDENCKSVPSKKGGHLVVTKLFGGGTPIIRYNAINDIVAPLYEPHECNISGDLIYKIHGRDTIRLFRKDGKIILASSLTSIFSRLLYQLKTSKIRDMKIIQQNLDEIKIFVVVDENLRKIGPSLNEIYQVLDKGFKEKFGRTITVLFEEIKEVNRDEPRIISKVDPSEFNQTDYL
jgi:phenylacetate-CoA ligase